jgi:hypothetical protein
MKKAQAVAAIIVITGIVTLIIVAVIGGIRLVWGRFAVFSIPSIHRPASSLA